MNERGSDSSAAGAEGVRKLRLPWRGVVVALAMVMGWMLPSSVSAAQATGAQSRACRQLQAALNRVGDRGSARQALVSRLQRLGCTTSGPTTTAAPAMTTTTSHFDCPLPGGGVGPCPTSTTMFPGSTVPGSTVPGGSTTTSFFPGTLAPTSVPPPPTSDPTGPTTSSTLPPCPTTTTIANAPTTFPPTTVPCAP
jgi:hypothetical protein